MYRISDFLLFKGSIIIHVREWGRISNEFYRTTIQEAQKMSLVEDEVAAQRVASLDSVHIARFFTMKLPTSCLGIVDEFPAQTVSR